MSSLITGKCCFKRLKYRMRTGSGSVSTMSTFVMSARSGHRRRREREENRRRGRHPERRRVVLGDVQGVEAEPVVGLGELEPALEELGERLAARIHVIENAELHFSPGLLAPRARPDRDVTS